MMIMKELQPINQQVCLDITPKSQEKRTVSGIIIPETVSEKSNVAPIVWMSVIENSGLKPGDTVLFKPFGGTELEFEGRKYLFVNYMDILAKVVETEAI
jgi:chaperonin GroES